MPVQPTTLSRFLSTGILVLTSLILAIVFTLGVPDQSFAKNNKEHMEHKAHKKGKGHNKNAYVKPGHRMKSIPPGHRKLKFKNKHYYLHNGAYYQQQGGYFVSIVPPLGIIVPVLPAGALATLVNGLSYWHLNDVYYQRSGQEYIVVAAPAERVTPKRPSKRIAAEVIVTVHTLNVRSGPGTTFGVMGHTYSNDRLKVIKSQNGWIKAHLPDGNEGWVRLRFTRPATTRD